MIIRFLFILFFCFHTSISYSQVLTEGEITLLAKELNDKSKGLDIGYGIISRGCLSIGRTIIYQYDVPKTWSPSINLKKDLISNLKISGSAQYHVKHNINVDYYYYKENILVKKISIQVNELSTFNFELGDYLSIDNHPKAKDVKLKLKVPKKWEIKEGDRPNIIKKFLYDANIYTILIKDNVTFLSRAEAKEYLSDKDVINEYIEETISFLKNKEILDYKVLTIDSYPTLEFKVKSNSHISLSKVSLILKYWIIFYEDKLVLLQGAGLDDNEFQNFEKLYNLITNSIIFPEQYK